MATDSYTKFRTLPVGGGNFNVPTPTLVSGLSSVVSVSAGVRFSLAIDSSGQLWAWGSNSNGQLGTGDTTARLTPHAVSGMTNIVAAAGGFKHTLALDAVGQVWAWGDNFDGQLGIGSITQHLTPQLIPTLSNIVAIAAGDYHSVALDAAGQVWVWGSNVYSQLTPAITFSYNTVPVLVTGIPPVQKIAAGGAFNLVLTGTNGAPGEVWAWGNGTGGALGVGGTFNQSVPQLITTTGSSIVSITAGINHSIAIGATGQVWVWGSNLYGELGLGDNVNRLTPVPATFSAGGTIAAAGNYFTVGIDDSGRLLSWGLNDHGQLGQGDFVNRSIPTLIPSSALQPLALTLAQDPATDDLSIALTNGVAAAPYFLTFSLDALNLTTPGSGIWGGLHIPIPDLIGQLNAGSAGTPPFGGVLNANGSFSYTVPGGVTGAFSGVTFWAIGLQIRPIGPEFSNIQAITLL